MRERLVLPRVRVGPTSERGTCSADDVLGGGQPCCSTSGTTKNKRRSEPNKTRLFRYRALTRIRRCSVCFRLMSHVVTVQGISFEIFKDGTSAVVCSITSVVEVESKVAKVAKECKQIRLVSFATASEAFSRSRADRPDRVHIHMQACREYDVSVSGPCIHCGPALTTRGIYWTPILREVTILALTTECGMISSIRDMTDTGP